MSGRENNADGKSSIPNTSSAGMNRGNRNPPRLRYTPSRRCMDMSPSREASNEMESDFSESRSNSNLNVSMESITEGKGKKTTSASVLERKLNADLDKFRKLSGNTISLILTSSHLRDTAKDLVSANLEWGEPPSTVLLVKKPWDQEVTCKMVELVEFLVLQKQFSIFIEDKVLEGENVVEQHEWETKGVSKNLKSWSASSISEIESVIDFVICLGGDGTLLYVSSLFQYIVPPVVSFHLGSLGFLTPFDFKDHQRCLNHIIRGDAVITLRERLECRFLSRKTKENNNVMNTHFCRRISKTEKEEAPVGKFAVLHQVMNEIVIDRGPSPYLSSLEVYCDGIMLTTVQADGLIIATPTGSTAYSVSAGGSMVHPSVPCILLTPICPHTLSFRPLILPDTVELQVVVPQDSRNTAWVSFDGRNREELCQGEAIMVTVSRFHIPTVNEVDQSSDWFKSLIDGLQWNTRKRQKEFAM
eukprot:Nk52_evm1s378 gene=Nk52_evmTU1s378